MTPQSKINVFVLRVCPRETFIFAEEVKRFFEMLAECSFIGVMVKLSRLSKQTADWWNR